MLPVESRLLEQKVERPEEREAAGDSSRDGHTEPGLWRALGEVRPGPAVCCAAAVQKTPSR